MSNPSIKSLPSTPITQEQAAILLRNATIAAIATAVFLISIKFVALYLTGSLAMMGTLTDSVLDGLASLINFFAVRHALTPADAEHRFGHGKAEALAGLGQAILILGSAGFIAYEAIRSFGEARPIENSIIGIGTILIAIAVTLALVAFQRRVVARTGSAAIAADSLHYSGDLLMNLAALMALILAGVLNWVWADGAFALLIAALLAYGAWRIVALASNQLMDHELSDEDRLKICNIVEAHPEVIGLHDLRTRKSGMDIFVQFHMELERDITLVRANRISHEVEASIVKAFPGAEVIIHGDPDEPTVASGTSFQ